MKVVFTAAAASDLGSIGDYLRANHPQVAAAVERRIRMVIARVARFPESAQRVVGPPEVRVVPLVRYPYKVFYRVTEDAIEVLHIHHTARQAPWEKRG